MVEGPLWNKILLFAIPIALSGILQQLFNTADLAIVGWFSKNENASQAAVSTNTSIINLIVNLFLGMSLGTSVVIANAVGAKDDLTVKKTVNSSILFAVVAGFIALGIGQAVARPVLFLMEVNQEYFILAETYLRVYLLGLPFILLYNYEAAIFRSVGDSKTPLYVLFIAGLTNICLNILFVALFKMDVAGVAIATVISNAVGAGILFILLTKEKSVIKVNYKEIRIHKSVFIKILKIGIPAGLQSAVYAFANIIMQSAINSLGTNVTAGSGIGYSVELIAFYIINSFSQTCTTFVGQNYGAKKIGRCKKTLLLCLAEGFIALGICASIMLPLGRNILGLFNGTPEVVEIGYTRLKYILFAYIFSTTYENLAGYLRGYGISLVPSIIVMSGVCGVRLFWKYVLFPQNSTFAFLMKVFPISIAVTAFVLIIAVIIHTIKNRKKYKAKN